MDAKYITTASGEHPFSLGLPCPSDCRSFPKSIICSQSKGLPSQRKKCLRKRQPSHLKYFRLENL